MWAGDLAPKARKMFFTKVRSQRAPFFVYRRPQGIYAGLTSQLQREQTTGTPPFCFPSVVSPIYQIGKTKCAYIVRFFVIARDRRTPPPSQAGVGFGLWLGSPVWFCRSIWRHEIKLRRHQGPTAGGVFWPRKKILSILLAPRSNSGITPVGLLERYKDTSSPPFIAPSVAAKLIIEHPMTAGHLGSRRICLSVFVPLTAILQGSV